MEIASTAAVIGIDGGKSGLRLSVQDAGRIWRGESSGTFHGAGLNDVDAVLGAVRNALHSAGFTGAVQTVCAGLTGLPADRAAVARLATAMLDLTGAESIILVEDCVIAHRGALARAGTVVSAGTGSIALAVGADGTNSRRDGWGPVIGDRGSGFDVGRSGLVAAWGAIDGVSAPTSLVASAIEFLGGADMASIQRFYGSPGFFARVSSFAPCVFDAARDIDPVAQDIVHRAAELLASTVAAAAASLPASSTEVSYSGRIFDAGEVYLKPFAMELKKRGLILRTPLSDALTGALALAADASRGADGLGIYSGLVLENSTRRSGA